MSSRVNKFLFGAEYYPEHWPEEYWKTDAQRMQECGVNTVRMGEFAWYYFEPEEGTFQFSLFDKVIELLARHGIKTIFCTPTAAPPKWLTHTYPEVLAADRNGNVMNDQTRRQYSFNSKIYRKFSKIITEKLAAHYRDNPHIIGWQTDNEFNCHIDEYYGEADRKVFRVWLKEKYGSLEELNNRWGCQFWSQWYTGWDQIDLPLPSPVAHNPALKLDYKRFISDSVISFQKEQVDIIRAYRPDDFITHNGTFKNIDYYAFCNDLDIFSFDNYPVMYADPRGSAAYNLTVSRSFMNRFMIMEQQSGMSGQEMIFPSPKPGQMSLWAMQAVAHGADGIVHFRWRTARRGIEQYWYGVLDHDNVPRERYAEFAEEGQRLHAVSEEIFESAVPAAIAVIKNFENEWVSGITYLSEEQNLKNEYREFVRQAAKMRRMIDFIDTGNDFSRYKVIFAPHLIMMDENLAEKIAEFVKNGGIFALSAHSAIKDFDNAMTEHTIPIHLSELFGLEIDRVISYKPPSAEENSLQFEGGTSLPVSVFAESLKTGSARQIAQWKKDFIKDLPACTENNFGKGKAVYYGSFFTEEAIAFLLAKYAKEAGIPPLLENVPDDIEITMRTKNGQEYYFLLNHSGKTVSCGIPGSFYDLIIREEVTGTVSIRPFGYCVLKKR